MSRWSEEEAPPPVVPWAGGHKRPSAPKALGWTEPTSGTWTKEGWSIVACKVENCNPSAKSRSVYGDVLHRVFPPGSTRHIGSFTVLADAKQWVEKTQLVKGKGLAEIKTK